MQNIDDLDVRVTYAVVNAMLFSKYAVIARLDFIALTPALRVGGSGSHFHPEQAQVFFSLSLSKMRERVVAYLNQALFSLG